MNKLEYFREYARTFITQQIPYVNDGYHDCASPGVCCATHVELSMKAADMYAGTIQYGVCGTGQLSTPRYGGSWDAPLNGGGWVWHGIYSDADKEEALSQICILVANDHYAISAGEGRHIIEAVSNANPNGCPAVHECEDYGYPWIYYYTHDADDPQPTPTPEPAPEVQDLGRVNYEVHVQDYGWMSTVCDGAIAGTVGESKRLEAIRITSDYCEILCRVHIQDVGWTDWMGENNVCGTIGEAKRLEAIQLKTDHPELYDIYYQAHVQNVGWQGWVKNEETAGTEGQALRLEAIKILLVNKGEQPNLS